MSEHEPIRWGAEALWEQLQPLLPGLGIEIVARVASTNAALIERAHGRHARVNSDQTGDQAVVRRSVESAAFGRRAIDLQPCLLVAEQQTAGRGRLGRVWQSSGGASLTFSLALPLAVADWSGLSLAVGVALCEALDPAPTQAGAPRLALKWPNDLWLVDGPAGDASAGRKLGGILIETVGVAAQRLAVIGVGLNVAPFEAAAVNTGFATLSELEPALAPTLTAPATLARIALPLVRALHQFERDGFAAFAARFAQRDLLAGHGVRTTLASVPEGVACGISPLGALRVRAADGTVAEVTSGEVSVRLAAGP